MVVFGNSNEERSATGPLASYSGPSTQNRGIILDGSLKLDQQIRSVVKTDVSQLRVLSKVKAYLPSNVFEKIIHAFITSRLDYWTTSCTVD